MYARPQANMDAERGPNEKHDSLLKKTGVYTGPCSGSLLAW